jgi:hypothetical protein
MRPIGISTGALARGDFQSAWHQVRTLGITVVEFSALRESELQPLVSWIRLQDVAALSAISVHAPSRRAEMSETAMIEHLSWFSERGWHVVVHPGMIQSPRQWERLGSRLCIENMDKRAIGRTVEELEPFFEALPAASFCLDLGHARQVDPTMTVARRLLSRYGSRLAQIHISEVDSACLHRRLSMASVWANQLLSRHIPEVPVIIESELVAQEVYREIEMVSACFSPIASATETAGSTDRSLVNPT